MASKKKVNALKKLKEVFGDSIEYRGEQIASGLRLPSLALILDGEVAEKLRREYQPNELIVLHHDLDYNQYSLHNFPRLYNRNDNRSGKTTPAESRKRRGKEGYMGCLIPGDILAGGLAKMSDRKADNALSGLEQKVAAEIESRERHDKAVRATAETLASSSASENASLKQMLQSVIFSQYKEPEYFCREPIQNSATAAPASAGGKIDVYVNMKDRLFMVEDNGIGMSRDVLENVFFNCFKSLNEEKLGMAEGGGGRFGIGAKSIFGLGHDYVKIDTNTENGDGASVIVDSNLEIEGYCAPLRKDHGTSIEIKLSDDSKIDLGRVVEILKEDCGYVPTPITLHLTDESGKEHIESINKKLVSKQKKSVSFDEQIGLGGKQLRLTGYVEKGSGELELLSYNIVVDRVNVDGIRGAINCNSFSPMMSRDSLQEDHLLELITRYAVNKSRKFSSGRIDKQKQGINPRLQDYYDFMIGMLFNEDGSPNLGQIENNLDEIIEVCSNYAHDRKSSNIISRELENSLSYQASESFFDSIDDKLVAARREKGKKAPRFYAKEATITGISGFTFASLLSMFVCAVSETGYDFIPYAAISSMVGFGALIIPYAVQFLETGGRLAYSKIKEAVKEKIVEMHDSYEHFSCFEPAELTRYRENRALSNFKTGLAGSAKLLGGGLGIYGLSLLANELMIGLNTDSVLAELSDSSATEAAGLADAVSSAVQQSSSGDINMLPYIAAGLGLVAASCLAYITANPRIKKASGLSAEQEGYIREVNDYLIGAGAGMDGKVFYAKDSRQLRGKPYVIGRGQQKNELILSPKISEQEPAWKLASRYLLNEANKIDEAKELMKSHLGGDIDG